MTANRHNQRVAGSLLRTNLLPILILTECVLSAPSANSQTQPRPADVQLQTDLQNSGPANTASSKPANTAFSTPENTASSKRIDDGWHFELSPYIWFAGAHGTVGALGRTASVHASPSDLLSHFNFGIMGAAEARHNRVLLNGDLLWIRLSDSQALPFPGLIARSVDVRVGQFLWTSKIGYRVIDNKKLKADANVGARYWHLGQRLSLNPSILGGSFTASQGWADIVVGGRILIPLGPKTSFVALGDVGGWNTTAKLDYQFAALLTFALSPKWMLGMGYRYLFVDYRNRTSLYNMVTSGAVLGLTYRFK